MIEGHSGHSGNMGHGGHVEHRSGSDIGHRNNIGHRSQIGNRGPTTNEPGFVRDIARSEVLHRHARLTRNGRPIFCAPSQAELRGTVIPRQGRGTDGKVIYPTREAAEAAARELEDLGARPLRSYVCGRSRNGHYHLTSDSGARTLHQRIPQQRRPLSA